jgi:drug/metabolite transporter (DMT)-like permease
LHERLKIRIWLGLVVALAGGVLVGINEACHLTALGLACPDWSSFYAGKAIWGNLLALVGAIMAAGYMVAGRRLRPTLSLVAYIGTVYPVAAILLDLMAVFSGGKLAGFSLTTGMVFVALALIPQLLGHTSYNYALGYLPAAYVSIATLAEPIGTTLLAVFILGELPTLLEVIGGLVILAGIGLASWNRD